MTFNRKRLISAACLCLAALAVPALMLLLLPKAQKTDGAPALFYYDGSFFVYHGYCATELPEGYEQAVEVRNVGDAFTETDFDGNVDGVVFLDSARPDTAYLRWRNWGTERDGPEPYLRLERER